MTLEKHIDSLAKDEQFKVAIRLINLALPVWENYANKNQLTYRDTVIGLTHTVDKQLLKNTIEAVESYFNSNKIKKIVDNKSELIEIHRQFKDPIVALQDSDWELPDQVQKTFYAVHNLIDALLGKDRTVFDESTIYVSINQAVDALVTSQTFTFDNIKSLIFH